MKIIFFAEKVALTGITMNQVKGYMYVQIAKEFKYSKTNK